ncbi:hypothetical protein B0H16DRAFT_1759458 [Mycena metata]|uniref:Uncharacterized protein n=1 Tax=Mycena metata TaxID=1033252 RepID=A0AAD7IAY0_9AGAR|nr:hypothetical protein B0H16DRAFT_1759458 [Mycena metata]
MPTKKESKKEIYRYDAAAVPDIMPFPALALLATTKGEEIPVPDLNDYQQSWIHDVALRDVNFEVERPTRAESTKFYDKVKMDAFEAKAFQHAVQPGDAAEEASLSKAIAKWKRDNVKKNKKTKNANDANDAGGAEGAGAADDAAGPNEEEDEGKAGLAVADKTRAAANKVTAATAPAPIAPTTVLAKLMGLATYTARNKFRDERHAEIHEYSLTLAGANAGGNFRKAEALMWAKEDQAFWADVVAAEEEDVDWEACQGLIVGGFQHLIDTLSANPKFRPFVANISMGWLNEKNQLKLEWVETVPSGVKVRQRFEDQYKELTRSCLNAMYAWAEKPLQDYVATRDSSAAPAAPVFPHTAEALNDVSPNAVGQSIHAFLTKSYAAFGNGAIPWAAITSAPSEYFDTEKFDVSFDSTGLESFQGKWHALGEILASGAGEGTLGFFRKVSAAVGEKEAEAEHIEREKQEQERVEAEQREREHADSERLKRERVEQEKQEQERVEAEQQECVEVEQQERVEAEQQEHGEAEQRERQRVEREKQELEREKQELEQEKQELERVEQMNGDAPGAGAAQDGKAKKGAKKRKAEVQLVPEDAGWLRWGYISVVFQHDRAGFIGLFANLAMWGENLGKADLSSQMIQWARTISIGTWAESLELGPRTPHKPTAPNNSTPYRRSFTTGLDTDSDDGDLSSSPLDGCFTTYGGGPVPFLTLFTRK